MADGGLLLADERLLVSDVPVRRAGDGLGFVQYAGPLAKVIASGGTDTPFTIGVFGPWGSGKSSLLSMVDEDLEQNYQGRTIRVHFNPWLHRKEPNMLVSLLHALNDTLLEQEKERSANSRKHVAHVLGTITANIVLGKVSGGNVKLDDIKTASEEYSRVKGEVESEMRKIRSTLQGAADHLAEQNIRLVFFIDDLDRCEPSEIIDLLESVKLFLDLRNVVVVLAIAKDVIDRGVAVKYRDFGFTAEQVVEIGNEYLDKLIQLPLYLAAFDASKIGSFLSGFTIPPSLQPHIGLLQRIVAPNPRHIKRVLNLAAFTGEVAAADPARLDFRLDLVIRLIVLRIQSPALYRAAAERPSLLTDLEAVYQGRLRTNDPTGFVHRHGVELASRAQSDITVFFRSELYLGELFAASTFGEAANVLADYIAVLGG
ncbi:KAP family P-loop NTPase fold protein [Streptomyces europaeiscabiei]|uniref:KAP family P-loop NTPase fold protein n=1 Tax=Streptomyces europaeiscabiei TaxID=146819 RepID=UPI0029AA1FBA|nr:P-loop NTPase fold protein [Streptomyces europaeiscabiei]MDX2773659.1 P-loop NTPase fold protein [Streptomyces europaeiscabiei]